MSQKSLYDRARAELRPMASETAVFQQVAADSNARLNATAELGKLGITLSEPSRAVGQLPKSEALSRRAELRVAMNALTAHAKAKPTNMTDSLVDAADFLAAEIALISNSLDLDEAARAHFEGAGGIGNESVLRDQSGRRVGVRLSSADLRNTATIAKKLGTNQYGDGEAMNLASFFRGVAGMHTTESVRNALSEGTGASGGYAVPTLLLPGVLAALAPASSLLQAGANIAMLDAQQAGSFNIAAVDTLPTAAWRSEGGAVVQSDPIFRGITITTRSLAFQFKVSRELLQDAPGLEGALQVAIAQAFAGELDRAGLRGSGTAPEIRGLLNTTNVNAITSGTNGAVLTNYAKFINAARAIKEANAPAPTAAIMAPRTDESVALFADTTGQPLRRPDALADWQFLTTSQVPTNLTVGTSTDCSEIYVGDFRQCTFFMRQDVSVQLLREAYASTGEIGFACHARVDFAPAYAKAFAVISGVR